MEGHINSKNRIDSSLLTDKNNLTRIGKIQLSVFSFNVCGLAAKLRCPDFIEFLCKYDIIGIQESKTDDTDNVCLTGYACVLNNRRKLSRYRSGGIALFVKNSTLDYVNVVSSSNSKFILWCTI